VRRLLDVELAGAERRIRRDSVAIGFGGLLIGSTVTLVVTLLVHPLH
jgi:hypothetical protein